MPHKEERSPTRQYEVTLTSIWDESDVDLVALVDLPVTLINNVDTVRVWYAKYVPEGYAIASVTPFEAGEEVVEAEESDYIGFGDELDYVGSEEDPDGFSVAEVDDED